MFTEEHTPFNSHSKNGVPVPEEELAAFLKEVLAELEEVNQ
jgi:hypothetical protein